MSSVVQLVGQYPSLAANGVYELPLRTLTPLHSVHALQLTISCTLTASGTIAAQTSTDLDNILDATVARVRLWGSGLMGEPINMAANNMRTMFQYATGQDMQANSAAGVTYIGSTPATGTFVFTLTIPFTDINATNDPDWAAPSSDQFRFEGNLELTMGTWAATAVSGSSTPTLQPSAVTAVLNAIMTDAHGLYIAPFQAFREQSLTMNNQQFEPGLYFHSCDTRFAVGSSPYNPTYNVFKDGKIIVSSVTGANLAQSWINRSRSSAGATDVTTRSGPIIFLPNGYTEEDLKPSLAQHVIQEPSGFSSGTVIYRVGRILTDQQRTLLAQYAGVPNPTFPVRAVLNAKSGDRDVVKVAAFKPCWIKAA
jgi:hypothetical protein